jgi:hypothetical protein
VARQEAAATSRHRQQPQQAAGSWTRRLQPGVGEAIALAKHPSGTSGPARVARPEWPGPAGGACPPPALAPPGGARRAIRGLARASAPAPARCGRCVALASVPAARSPRRSVLPRSRAPAAARLSLSLARGGSDGYIYIYNGAAPTAHPQVLPDPVLATATTSNLAMRYGQHWAWMGDGFRNPWARMVLRISGLNGAREKSCTGSRSSNCGLDAEDCISPPADVALRSLTLSSFRARY